MENNRIMCFLVCILLIACGIVGVTLLRVRYDRGYVPAEAVEDLTEILARDGIRIDRNIISQKRETGSVYVFDSEGYSGTVAQLLSGSSVKDTYAVPDGELVILENGDRCEFGENFTFRYQSWDADPFSPNIADLRQYTSAVLPENAESTVETVREFLNAGSRSFSGGSDLDADVRIDEIREYLGIEYVLCSRTIENVEITGNLALCTVENGKVTAAYGTWCFFTSGTSYSAQLTDILNILFNVKKDLVFPSSETERPAVTIESIHSCYSLYFFGEKKNFCLIPCWQIATDIRGNLIYNAINGTLYTKNTD